MVNFTFTLPKKGHLKTGIFSLAQKALEEMLDVHY
jgi:hypothetical protein